MFKFYAVPAARFACAAAARAADYVTILSHFPARAARGENNMASACLRNAALGFTSAPLLLAAPAMAQEATAPNPAADQDYAVHGQATFVAQGVGGFASPYQGDNSLSPRQVKETADVTLYLGLRPWKGGEIWVNPEVDQGFGLSNTLGAAGFPSAEAYKVGKNNPYFKLPRAFLRQTFALGGESITQEAATNQLRQTTKANRVVITLGKFGVNDVFDTNRFAHDPKGDFLNWSLVDTGSFDYAANAWGFTIGASAELYYGDWTLRAGLFNLSKIPNGPALETDLRQNQILFEIEHRHTLFGRAGAVRITPFRNRGRFGRFDEALALGLATGTPPATADVRRQRSREGISMTAEQDVTNTLGLFLRAGVSNGAIEPDDFTDIDRTVALGGALKGKVWGRPQDTVGLAGVVNGISAIHQAYLAAGGMGTLVGDGALHPGDEQIIEAYYAYRPVSWGALTFDYQHIANPGYNRDRGPANIFALRVHAGF